MEPCEIIEFSIKPSKYQNIFFNGLHLLAVLTLIELKVSMLLQAVLGLLLILHYSYYRRQYFADRNTISLRYSRTSGWQLNNRQQFETIEIQPTTFISPWIVIIHYCFESPNRAVHSIVCFKDALCLKEFKRLIVLLKIAGLAKKSPIA